MSQTPKVWSKFSVTKDSVTTKFQIIEATKDQADDLAQLMYGHFVTGETIAKAAGVAKSKEAFEEYKPVLTDLLNDPSVHIVICCVDNDNEEIGELVGASLMALTKKANHIHLKRLICRELGVPLTAALMTAYGTQKAAERDGWETVKEYNYEELGKMFDVTFDENGPPVAKLMVARA